MDCFGLCRRSTLLPIGQGVDGSPVLPFWRFFWRFRVWCCVVRFAVPVLTPFFAVSRLVSARLVYYINAIKKARFRGNFQGVFASVGFLIPFGRDAVGMDTLKDNKKGASRKACPRCGYLCRLSISSTCCRVIVLSLAYRVAVATSARVAPFGKIAVNTFKPSKTCCAVPHAVIIILSPFISSPSVIYCR